MESNVLKQTNPLLNELLDMPDKQLLDIISIAWKTGKFQLSSDEIIQITAILDDYRNNTCTYFNNDIYERVRNVAREIINRQLVITQKKV